MQESIVHVSIYISFAALTAAVCGFSSFCIINKVHLERGAMNAYSSYYVIYRRRKRQPRRSIHFSNLFFFSAIFQLFHKNVPSQIQIDHWDSKKNTIVVYASKAIYYWKCRASNSMWITNFYYSIRKQINESMCKQVHSRYDRIESSHDATHDALHHTWNERIGHASPEWSVHSAYKRIMLISLSVYLEYFPCEW